MPTVSVRATEMQVPTLTSSDERPVVIALPRALDRALAERLRTVLRNHPGYCEVRLAVSDGRGRTAVLMVGDGLRVSRDASLFAEIKTLFGPSCLLAA